MLLLPVGWVAAAAAVLDLVLLLLRVLIAFILTVLVLSVCVCCSWLCAMSGGEALLGAVLDHQPPP